MMNYKRLTLIMGHYGSGKTNIAVNLAYNLKKSYNNVAIADLDIVNPYFRTKDSEEIFRKDGIRLICSDYANSNVDIPAMPSDIYSLTDDKTLKAIIDVGGDDRGALAVGRLSGQIKAENDYEMLFVINTFRPLTRDTEGLLEVLGEIEVAAGLKFTGLINNSNLGPITTKEDILESTKKANELSKITGLPLMLTTVKEELYDDLKGEIENLFPLKLQKNILI